MKRNKRIWISAIAAVVLWTVYGLSAAGVVGADSPAVAPVARCHCAVCVCVTCCCKGVR